MEKKRIAWLDYARMFAILCVVMCHAAENYYRPVLLGQKEIEFIQWFFLNFLFMVGRLGVPIFLGITGVLMLGRNWKPAEFYKKYLFPMILTTEIWMVMNYLFQCIVQEEAFHLKKLLRQMLFLTVPGLSHMWYMPMIIGIYVIIPFLSKGMMCFTKKKDYILPGILSVFSFVILPTVSVFRTEAFPGSSLTQQVDVSFLGGIYGLYVVLGYMIGKKKILEKISGKWIILTGLLSFGFNIYGQYYLYSHHFYATTRLTWYTSAGIFIAGGCVFELFRRGLQEISINQNRFVKWIARCSFGIYLLHKPVQILVIKYFSIERLSPVVKAGIVFLVSFLFCILILFPISRYGGKIKKWIFLMK